MDHKQLFLDEMKKAGLPTELTDFQNEWEKLVEQSDFAVNNESPFSPFFRLQKAIMAEPAKHLVDTLAGVVMPNAFVMLAKDEWLDKHGDARSLERLGALKAMGNVQFSRQDTSGELVIPAGSVIESVPINGKVYRVITTLDTHFAIGEQTQLAVVEAEHEGESYNLAAGYFVKLVPDVPGVSVTNKIDWLLSPGQDIESDENYQIRQRDIFGTLGDFHVDSVYRSILNQFPGIRANNIEFDKSAPRGPGSVNAYVYLEVGDISAAVLDQMNNHFAAGNTGHGDDFKVFAMPKAAHNITVNYTLKPNAADIEAELENFIRAAFRENNAYQPTRCKPNDEFSFSVLSAELHAQFSGLKNIKFSLDTIVAGFELPSIGTLTVQYG